MFIHFVYLLKHVYSFMYTQSTMLLVIKRKINDHNFDGCGMAYLGMPNSPESPK